MPLRRYCIDAAIDHASPEPGVVTASGGKEKAPAWGVVFHDHCAFEVRDDADAVDHAEDLQRQHEGAYLMLCGGHPPSNWEGRPRYVDRLFHLHPAHGLEPVIA